MLELSKAELRQVQFIQLEMLIEVKRICEKHHIKYNIFAGTLLGAVRHAGFIPWDDDADIAFLRSEYEKFREICKTELDHTRFYFQDYRNTKGYRWGYGKLRRKGTVFLREYQEHMPYEQGIFIDLFPLDGVPNNYILRCLHNFHCFCIRKILWSAVGKVSEQRIFMKKWYELLSKLPENKVLKSYQNLIIQSNLRNTRKVRALTFPTPNRIYGYEKSWYEHSRDILFEGYQFKGIEDYDSYLEFKYGDYKTLPRKSERKTHPVSQIKLIAPCIQANC